MEEFNFNLLRVSILQIIKAAGYDKCKNTTVTIITDLYVTVLKLLLAKALHYGNGSITSMDLLQAMIDIGIIKVPLSDRMQMSSGTKYASSITTTTTDKYNTRSIDGFKQWLESINQTTLRQLNEVPLNYKQIVWENRKDDGPNTNNVITNVIQGFEAEDGDDNLEEIKQMKLNWLNYLIEKDNKFGKDIFVGTYLSQDINGEYLVNDTEYNQYLPINQNN